MYASGGADTVTLVYVHGNRFTWSDAIEYGHYARSALRTRNTPGLSVRFVIWSWPSAPIRGVVRDVRVKAMRADVEAAFLARFLAGLDDDSRVSLLGLSFGARIITGALHLRAGGRLNGLVAPPAPAAQPVRVVLMAAALDNDWLLPGHFHGRALSQTDAVLSLYNSCDPVLKRYHLLQRCSRAQALGYTGAVGPLRCPDGFARFEQHDVCRVIGRTHHETSYFFSCALMSHARRYLLWQAVP